jgi:hypothetical protein
VDARLAPGSYEAVWTGNSQDGAPAGSGIYFCWLVVAGQDRVERLLRVR